MPAGLPSGACDRGPLDVNRLRVPRVRLPLALAALHRALPPGARIEIDVPAADSSATHDTSGAGDGPGDESWRSAYLVEVLAGAGFDVDRLDGSAGGWRVGCTRAPTLADMVGPGMRVLVCGLNPSVYSAERGVGYARPGNRFWPAALAAGLVRRDRDPVHALVACGVGMTDLVKRPTAGAAELTAVEYRAGAARVERLVRWLCPAAVCFVGLAGWRAALDRQAIAGRQPALFGGRPAYLMPSTSGLNAHASVADLTAHLAAAARLAGIPVPPVPDRAGSR